jgi:GGDEF domain-containing protein
VIARLGGDEFIVLVAGLDAVQIDALAQELVDGHVVSVTYGIAVGSPGPDVLGALTQVADADMYRRKMLRRNR